MTGPRVILPRRSLNEQDFTARGTLPQNDGHGRKLVLGGFDAHRLESLKSVANNLQIGHRSTIARPRSNQRRRGQAEAATPSVGVSLAA